MTVSQLRDRMMEKVVPEKVMPQNIAEFLMDEDAELPELDAFTFLNRLRALGIGSADFLYLLSGCGAPEEAVEKVRRNPAMNLQSLILTLDGAGLTPQDYTRMLYTARQLWERTLTMRLEKAENAPEEIEDNAPEEIEDNAPEEVEDTISEEIEGTAPEETEDIAPEETEDIAPEETEDIAPEETEDIPPEEIEDTVPEEVEDNALEEVEDNVPEEVEDNALEEVEDNVPEEVEDNVPEETEDIAPEEAENTAPEETSEFRPVDMELLRQSLIADAEEISGGEAAPESAEAAEAPDEADEDEEYEPQYCKGALITSAAGAAVLFAAAAAVSFMGFAPIESVGAHFAADSSEIFGAIYSSYNSGIVGAEIQPQRGGGTLFGDIIVESDGSLGTFFDDGKLYTAAADGISCADASGGQLSEAELIEPPSDAEFVYVNMSGGALYAVFDGAECGFVRIDGGKVTYTARQDGVLTDFRFDGETACIGSVYTPPFTESFSVEQTECYLPSLGTGEKTLISPENILMSGADGCSYAVSACYSLEDGAVVSSAAALGYPVYSSADGFSAMTDGEKGLLLQIVQTEDGLSFSSARVGKFTSAAGGAGVYADADNTDEGTVLTIYNSELSPVSALKNFDREVTALRFDGNVLYISGDGEFMAADCSDAAAPAIYSERRGGKVVGDSALLTEITADGLEMALYSRENGKAVQKYSYMKKLTAEELSSLELCAYDAAYIGGGVCGAAYKWFDGVSVVSEYAVFGEQSREVTLFDDKTGFTAAFERDGRLCLVFGGGKISSDIHI